MKYGKTVRFWTEAFPHSCALNFCCGYNFVLLLSSLLLENDHICKQLSRPADTETAAVCNGCHCAMASGTSERLKWGVYSWAHIATCTAECTLPPVQHRGLCISCWKCFSKAVVLWHCIDSFRATYCGPSSCVRWLGGEFYGNFNMVFVVSHWPFTLETRVWNYISPYGIWGGQSGDGRGFSPASTIPPLLCTHSSVTDAI
jgi:hypothetical protein